MEKKWGNFVYRGFSRCTNFLKPRNSSSFELPKRYSSIFPKEQVKKQKDLINSIKIKSIMISFSEEHEIWIDGSHFRKTENQGGSLLFSIIFPDDIEKFPALRKH